MPITIYHNPRCSKSRQTLEIIRQAGIAPNVVAYLDTPPDADTLLSLALKIGVPLGDLLRRGEQEFRDAGHDVRLNDERALAEWMSAHPKVIQRPIVVDEESGRAVVGRPPERVRELLD